MSVVFETVAAGGCRSYVLGCAETCAAVVIDPEVTQLDRYLAIAARNGLRLRYVIDTHTHADHFSARRQLGKQLGAASVMHRASPAPAVDIHVDDGELVRVGKLRLGIVHTPGHTSDSMCLVTDDRVFTGDTLLIGATGRTDLPTGDPDALHRSLFERVLKLDPALAVYPAHEYKGRERTTIAEEIATNPRLQARDREAFVDMMRGLNLTMPAHITEALRTNLTGGKTVAEMLEQAAAAVPFMALSELAARVARTDPDLVILDVREREAYDRGHIAGAKLLPRGQLELRVNEDLPDPTRRVLVYCELGLISTLAAATLREMGFQRAVALDGGMKAWRAAGYPVAS